VLGGGSRERYPHAPGGTTPAPPPASTSLTPLTGSGCVSRRIWRIAVRAHCPPRSRGSLSTCSMPAAWLNAALAGGGKKTSYTHLHRHAIVRRPRASGHDARLPGRRRQAASLRSPRVTSAWRWMWRTGRQSRPGRPVIERRAWTSRASATYEALVDKARTNKLLPDDFAGATITLTNPGRLGRSPRARLMEGSGSIIGARARSHARGSRVMTISRPTITASSRGRSRMFLRRLDDLLREQTATRMVVRESGLTGSRERGVVPSAAQQEPLPAPLPGVVVEAGVESSACRRRDGAGQSHPQLRPPRCSTRSHSASEPRATRRSIRPLGLTPNHGPPSRPTCCGSTCRRPWPRVPQAASDLLRPIAYEVEHIGATRARVAPPGDRIGGPQKAVTSEMKRSARVAHGGRDARALPHKATSARSALRSKGSTRWCRCSTRRSSSPHERPRRVVLGMAHRGRWTCSPTSSPPYETTFAEFEVGASRGDAHARSGTGT